MFSADSLFCGHHSSSMAYLSYSPRFAAIIPQTWPPRVMRLVVWPLYLKHGLLELCSSFCEHHTSNMDSSSYNPRFVAIIPQTWPPRVMLLVLWPPYLKHGLLELYYRVVAIILQTWPPRVILLVLWTSYLKHGLLELFFSLCGHHTSNMASSSYTPRVVATIPQAWNLRVIFV